MKDIKIFWTFGGKAYKGKHEMDVLKSYMVEKGWNFTDDPKKADTIFFGSESSMTPELLELPARKICYFWGMMYWRLLKKAGYDYLKNIQYALLQCDKILTPSLMTYYQLLDWGIESMPCYFGADDKLIESVPMQDEGNQVIAIARLVNHKRIDVIIDAISMLEPKPSLKVIGVGDKRPHLKMAKKIGVDIEVKDLADMDKIIELKKSFVFVSASAYEGFGIPPAEAMLAGIPVLLNDIPIHREIYKDNATYFYGSKDLAFKISEIKFKHNHIVRAKKYAKRELSMTRVCERLEAHL